MQGSNIIDLSSYQTVQNNKTSDELSSAIQALIQQMREMGSVVQAH